VVSDGRTTREAPRELYRRRRAIASAAAVFAHDGLRERQKRFIGGIFALDAALLVLFGPILRWI